MFNDKYCDELILLDIRSSIEDTPIQFDLIEECASQCMMPLCYGCISSIEEARLYFLWELKIVLQSSVCRKQSLFLSCLVFGSQSICVSLDIRRSRLSGYKVLNKVAGFKKSMWLEAAIAFQELGAGEILINYVDHDGTQMGLNHELIKNASSSLSIPLIAAGGSSSLSDMQQGLRNGASAIAQALYLFTLARTKLCLSLIHPDQLLFIP